MAKFKLEIATDNAAFEGEDRNYEIARILRGIADGLEQGKESGIARDINGNRVGEYGNTLTAKEEAKSDG